MKRLANRSLDVVCFGEAIVDFFPGAVGRPLSEIETFHRHLGGAPANVAVGLARLGAKAGLMTLVGNDEFGLYIRSELAKEGVDVRAVAVHRTARTGITFVSIGERGERSFSFYRDRCADQLIAPVDVDGEVIEDARIFHFGSSTLARDPARSATLAALADAREAGCVVSCDPNFRPHVWDEPARAQGLIRQAMADSDIVKLADEEIPPLFGNLTVEQAGVAMRELGVRLAIITLGARGCYVDAPSGHGYVGVDKVAVVDTTAAGDGFVAGLLSQLSPLVASGKAIEDLDRGTIEKALSFANQVGARTVSRIGSAQAIPRKEEIT